MKKTISILLVSTFLVTSCSMAPDYKRPNVETPANWSQVQGNPSRVAFDWWKSFGSDELNQLMADGLNNNLDLRASFQRIRQSRASLQVARSTLYPSVDLSANVTRDKSIRDNGNSFSNDGDTNLNAGLDVSYELDLFGANRSERDASEAALMSTKYQHEALALIVMSDISKTYFNILNAREREKISEQNLKNAQNILRIVQARYDAGSASGLEVSQQKSSLASFEAAKTSIQQEISVYENALAILLGKPPQSVKVAKTDLTNLKIPAIAPEQPSELAARRPDILSAEADLMTANANIGAARAAFFPSINLGVGLAAAASPISSPVTLGLSTASSVLAPIFSGGSLVGNLRFSEAQKAELVENYRKTVLVSFQEVEDAMTAEKASASRETSYRTAVAEAQKAYDISMLRYKAGSIDFQTVLDSQSALLQAQQNYSLSRNERLSAAVDLFKAMGGGWNSR